MKKDENCTVSFQPTVLRPMGGHKKADFKLSVYMCFKIIIAVLKWNAMAQKVWSGWMLWEPRWAFLGSMATLPQVLPFSACHYSLQISLFGWEAWGCTQSLLPQCLWLALWERLAFWDHLSLHWENGLKYSYFFIVVSLGWKQTVALCECLGVCFSLLCPDLFIKRKTHLHKKALEHRKNVHFVFLSAAPRHVGF